MSLIIALLVALGSSNVFDRYSVEVKRIEKDLYQVQGSRVIIETRYCYEYAYGDDAILQWEGKYGDNWLLFVSSKTKCDVIALR